MLRAEQGRQVRRGHEDGPGLLAADGLSFADRGGMGVCLSSRCRDTGYSFGESADLLGKYGWFDGNSLGKSHPVGSLKPNDLGLFDMHGNAWEWCQDVYKPYAKGRRWKGDTRIKEDDNRYKYRTMSRVLRGGSFGNQASAVRSAYRRNNVPANRIDIVGFRPARTLPLGSFTALPLTPRRGRK